VVDVPEVPRRNSRRGRWLASQRADNARGLFSERLEDFKFAPIAPGTTGSTVPEAYTVPSLGGRYIRMLAMRGTTGSNFATPNGFELENLALRVLLNGQNDLIVGPDGNATSFAMLFGDPQSPFFWFVSPPVFRAGDRLNLTVANSDTVSRLSPEVGLWLMDDTLWQELYTRDWRAERSA
jgi:hypothetical protein